MPWIQAKGQSQWGCRRSFSFFLPDHPKPSAQPPHGPSPLRAVGDGEGDSERWWLSPLSAPTPSRERTLLAWDPRSVEGPGGQSVLLCCITGWFRGQKLQVLGTRVGKPAWGLQADMKGRARCQSACRAAGVRQGRVEAAEPVGPWLHTEPTSPQRLWGKASPSHSKGKNSVGPSHPHPSASGHHPPRPPAAPGDGPKS